MPRQRVLRVFCYLAILSNHYLSTGSSLVKDAHAALTGSSYWYTFRTSAHCQIY